MAMMAKIGRGRAWRIALLAGLLAACGRTAPASGGDAQAPSGQQSAAAQRGLIIYQQLDEAAMAREEMETKPELIVTDGAGNELHRITVPGNDRGKALAYGNRAIYTTITGEQYLVDAAAGTASKLALPPGEPLFDLRLGDLDDQATQGRRWGLFDTIKTLYLINLGDGTITDLTALAGASRMGVYALAADEEHALITGNGGIWVVPTAHPEQLRKIALLSLRFGAFSDDSAWIVYSGTTGSTESAILERVDGGERREIATGADPIWVAFVPGSQQVLLDRQSGLAIYDPATGSERALLAYPPTIQYVRVFLTPDGRRALLEIRDGDDLPTWSLLSLADGALQPLDALRDGYPLTDAAILRWSAFAAPKSDLDRKSFLLFDSETGALSPPVRSETSGAFPLGAQSNHDGSIYLIREGIGNGMVSRFWILSKDGDLRRIAEGISADLSPDGTQALIGTFAYGHPSDPAQLAIIDTADPSKVIDLGSGYAPLWLNP